MSQKIPTFNINKFISQLRDPDTDFTIIAFNDLIKFLNTVQEFDLPLETIQTDFLPNVISRLADKVPDIVNPIFRIIVLLSEKLPIASLSSFFEEIFNFVNDPECQIRNQILSVLREVLTNSISFAAERQQTIVNFFINKLNENSDIEILIFNIDMMASLLECLGFLFDEIGLKHAKELITTHVTDARLDILPSVASLGRIWMYVAVMNGKQDQFNSMIKQLYEIGKTNSNAYTILSSMVCYRPSIYKDEAVNLLTLFYERIQVEEDDLAKKQEEDPEIDVYYDTPYVPHITDCISSLTSLVKTFPELYNDELVDYCISTAFTYLTYGITPSSNDDAENDGNEDDEDDFVIEGGEPGEVIELDEADDEVITGDDSWKIRKTAIALSIALIQCFTERFFDSLGFKDEETDCLSVVNTLIKDSDSGSQNDAFEFLKVVIHYYKNNLGEEDVFQWFSTLNLQLTSKNNQSIASIIVDTISYVLNEYGKIPDDLLVRIITSMQSLLNNNTIQSLLSFVLTIFNVVQPTTNILSAIAIILTDTINNPSISPTIPYIPTISKLFEYAGQIEDPIQEDSECVSKLKDLASSVISLCSSDEKDRIERNMQAFETLGVLIASFNEDILQLNDQCMGILVETFENEPSTKILKIVCRSIALIAASQNNGNKLESYADRIRSKLLSINFSQIDSAYLFICLWTLRILLENGIIDPSSDDCQSVAPYLAEIFSSSDPRNILLSTSIFMQMPTAALQSLDSLASSLRNQVLDHQIVMSYAKLIELCATQDASATEKLLISLINSEYEKADKDKLDDITPNVAFVIGFVSGNIREIGDKLLQDFQDKLINNKDEAVLQFVLQVVGEIGALVDLSSRGSLVDSIFALIHHQNREVFNAAAECVGHLSLKSTNNILPRALAEANKEKDNTVWILVILSMVKRLPFANKDQFEIDIQELQAIYEFLAQNANYDSPTERSIAESFSYLIKFDPQNYIEKLIELSKGEKSSGPVAAHSIALFFEDLAKSEDPYFLFNFIDKVLSSVNLDYPLVSEYFILCLKICLQIKQQHLNSNSSTYKINPSSENAFESANLFDYYDLVCQASIFNPDIHIVTIELGMNSIQKDIGSNLRLNAVNCLILILAVYSEEINVDNLFDIAYQIIKNDAKDEIKDQALVLLTKMALDKNILDQLYEIITQRKEIFPEIEEIIYPTGKQKVDILEDNYFRLIVALRISESKKIKEIEEIYAKHKDDAKIKKFESDLSYSVSAPSPFAGILSSGSASASLMKHFYPEALTIFLI